MVLHKLLLHKMKSKKVRRQMIKAFAMKSHRVADSSCQRSHSFISFSNNNHGQNEEHGRYISVGKSEFYKLERLILVSDEHDPHDCVLD